MSLLSDALGSKRFRTLRRPLASLAALLCLGSSPSHLAYTVKPGDALGDIASRYGLTAKELADLNELANPDRLRVGQELRIPRPGKPEEYLVKPGDTLGSIAEAHKIPLATLIRFNELQRPDRLRIGQRLLIPTEPIDEVTRSSFPSLTEGFRSQLNRTQVRPGRWRHIVIHHSATAQGTVKGMDEYHRTKRRMVNGLAYHFVIGNGNGMPDGEIAIGHRWTRQLQGGHLASEALNQRAIGICLVGNFEQSPPTQKQMASLEALTRYLMTRCNLTPSAVRTHRMMNSTRCPGRHFPEQTFMNRL